MSSTQTILRIAGLNVANNTFTATPEGGLLVARNVVINQKGVAEGRNGQRRLATFPLTSDIPFQVAEFQNDFLTSYAPSKTDPFNLGHGTSSVTAYSSGPYNPVDWDGTNTSYSRMKFGFAGQFAYFCTTTGPKCLENISDTAPRAAGLLQVPDPIGFGFKASGNNWLPYGSSVRIALEHRRNTSRGTQIISPPSGSIVVSNRVLMPTGMLTKAAGVATGTLPGGQYTGFVVGSTFTLTPGEANFPAGSYTVTGTPTPSSFTFAITAGAASSTLPQNADTGARAVITGGPLAPDTLEGDLIREYRSFTTTTTSPSEDMYLANEYTVTASDISSGQIVIEDYTPPTILFAPLYTSPSVQGATQANYPPPLYRDIAVWNGYTWYANTTGKHAMSLEMLGVGAPGGVQNNDTITIADSNTSVTFTFKTSPSLGTDVQIYSDGTFSQNVMGTTNNLITRFYAEAPAEWGLFSEGGVLPGKLRLERQDFLDDPLKVTVSRPDSWTPALDPAVPVETVAERTPNGLSYSKIDEPEAVPVVNFLQIGSKNYAISRIVPLRDALIVFKEGDGVYSVDSSFPFFVRQIDTSNIIAPDTACVCSNQVWALVDNGPGFLAISSSGGSEIISSPIQTLLADSVFGFPEDTFDYAFSVPYQVENRVICFLPTDFNVDDGPDLPILTGYVYNMVTKSWTTLEDAGMVFSGVATTENKLLLGIYDYISEAPMGRLTLERKDGLYTDKIDATWTNSIQEVNVNGNPLLIRLQIRGGIARGDGIQQGQWFTKFVAHRTDIGPRIYEVAEKLPWTVASCTIAKAYTVEIKFQSVGNPVKMKSLSKMEALYKPGEYANYFGRAIVSTDQTQADLKINVSSLGFGMTPFGMSPFGDPSPLSVVSNPASGGNSWTMAGQYFIGLRLHEVCFKMKLEGVALTLTESDSAVSRGPYILDVSDEE